MIDRNDPFAWQNGFSTYPREVPGFAVGQYQAGWRAAFNATMANEHGPERDIALLEARLENLTEVCRHLLVRIEWLEQAGRNV